MTFAEYNTDDNFNGSSNAMELVRLAKAEGKTRDETLNALSPLWKEDKKGNVKKALDYHFPESQKSEAANVQNTDMTIQQDLEKQKAQEEKVKNWNNTMDSASRMGAAAKNVDDHYIEQLPTSIYARYKNNEFGKAGTKEAKQRLAYFIMDAAASPLKALANGMSRFAGQGDRFEDTTSAYQKYQESNLAKGLENRWNKYQKETDAAMDLLRQREFADEDINEAIDKVSANNRLQTAYNRASEEQKAYILEVMTEIGDKIGDMNNTDFINTLMGMSAMGESLDYKEAAGMLAYRYGKDLAENPAVAKWFEEKFGISLDAVKKIAEAGEEKTASVIPTSDNGDEKRDEKKDTPKVTIPESPIKVPEKKTYEGETSREGSFWGGKLDDKTMSKYTELQSKKPTGIETELLSDEEIKTFLAKNPDMKGGDVLKKSGINDRITKQAKELKKAVDQAEKDYKANKDFNAYKARVNEINDYFTELEDLTKKFGYANFLLNYEGIHKAAKKVNKEK